MNAEQAARVRNTPNTPDRAYATKVRKLALKIAGAGGPISLLDRHTILLPGMGIVRIPSVTRERRDQILLTGVLTDDLVSRGFDVTVRRHGDRVHIGVLRSGLIVDSVNDGTDDLTAAMRIWLDTVVSS